MHLQCVVEFVQAHQQALAAEELQELHNESIEVAMNLYKLIQKHTAPYTGKPSPCLHCISWSVCIVCIVLFILL